MGLRLIANVEFNGEILEVRNITRMAIIILLLYFHLILSWKLKPAVRNKRNMIGRADWKGRNKINIGSTTATSIREFPIDFIQFQFGCGDGKGFLFYIICYFLSPSFKVSKFPYPFLQDWQHSGYWIDKVIHRWKTREPFTRLSEPLNVLSDHLSLQVDFPLYPLSLFLLFFFFPSCSFICSFRGRESSAANMSIGTCLSLEG